MHFCLTHAYLFQIEIINHVITYTVYHVACSQIMGKQDEN